MQKVVIDTNVLISALIQKSFPYLIVHELFLEHRIQICVSKELMTEYYDVLNRPKFSKFPNFIARAEGLLVDIESNAKSYTPKIKLEIITDIDDNMILELADECSADFIITGNTTDFRFPKYKNTKIVTPKEYWDNYKP